MTKCKKILVFFAIFFSFNSHAYEQKTSFENRAICEESKGVWRQFGNSCGNSCEAKFDEFATCTKEAKYDCDCGYNRCFFENNCIEISKYQEKFSDLQKQRDEEQAKIKLEREEKIKTDPSIAYYVNNLYKKEEEKHNAQIAVNNEKNKKPDQQKPKQSQNQQIASQPIVENRQEIIQEPQKIPPGFMQQSANSQEPQLPVIPLPQ